MKILLILFALFCGHASAAQVSLTMPANVVRGTSGFVTAGSAAFNGLSFNSGMTTQVAGRAVTVPAAWRLAANAPNIAIAAIRLNPGSLVTSAVAAYLLMEGIKYLNGQLVVEPTVTLESVGFVVCGSYGNLSVPACWAMLIGTTPDKVDSCTLVVRTNTYGINCRYIPNNYYTTLGDFAKSNYTCPINYTLNGTQCVGTAVPAGQSDWDRLAARPLPDAVAGDLATRGVPLPLDAPQVSPNPIDIPTSDPYPDPITGQRYRDKARITPQPSTPDVADVQRYKEPVDEAGNPISDPSTPPVENKNEDPCDLHPGRIGCIEKGEADDTELEKHDLGQAMTPVTVGGSSQCPPDKNLTYGGRQITFSYQPICTGAGWLNPVVLAIAWLLAGYILIGAVRES